MGGWVGKEQGETSQTLPILYLKRKRRAAYVFERRGKGRWNSV